MHGNPEQYPDYPVRLAEFSTLSGRFAFVSSDIGESCDRRRGLHVAPYCRG